MHLTEAECELYASNMGMSIIKLDHPTAAPPGCATNPTVPTRAWFNADLQSTAGCDTNSYKCICGLLSPPQPPPTSPPIQPLAVYQESGCETHITEAECESIADWYNRAFASADNNLAIPGCYSYTNNFGQTSQYFNSDFSSGRTCAESGFTCFCAL